MTASRQVVEGGIDEYIASAPSNVKDYLAEIRSLNKEIAPEAKETVSYFNLPGYSIEGYKYNGMFVWISHKKDLVRLHLIPPVIENHHDQLNEYLCTKR